MKKIDPENYPQTTRFLAQHPTLSGFLEECPLSNTIYGGVFELGGKFSPEAAKRLIDHLFDCSEDHLSCYSVENWLEFYCFIYDSLKFHENLIYHGFYEEARNYRRYRQSDEEDAKKAAKRKARKPKTADG